MSKVAPIDPNFKVIIDYLSNKQSNITILSLSQSLQDLRKQINLNWYSKFLQYDHISYLAEIWDALFQLLAENISDDPGLRISIFKTLGALIFALSPFIPFTTVASFLSSIQNKPSSPHLSIAIIASFCHISQFVSPLNFESFISKSPIVQYFSDLKQTTNLINQSQNQTFYVKYLPKIISNVKPLNLEFQRFLLSALLNTFGENPTLPFIFAIINLLKNAINPTVLLDDMVKYIDQKKQQRQLTLLMISPYLLEKEGENEIEEKNFSEITDYLNEKVKDDLFELAISTIKKDAPKSPSFSEFEQACRTLAAILEKEKNPSKINDQILIIKKTLNLIECPSYLKICTFPFIDSIDELTPNEDDKLSVITAKLSALTNFLKRFPTIENFEKILKIFIKFLNTESKEILTNLINAVLKCFSLVSVDLISDTSSSEKVFEIKKNLRTLLNEFLNTKTSNFVQNVAIVNLIQSVSFDVGDMLIVNYRKISFHIVFNFCFSVHNNLSETAINVLKSIVEYRSVSEFVSLLFDEIDFFDHFSLFKICEVSNALIGTIGPQTVTELRCLIDPVFESLTLIHRTSDEFTKIIRTEAEVFSFFNKMRDCLTIFNDRENCEVHFLNDNQNEDLKMICFDLIGRIFESFTGINPQLPTISPPIPPITSLIETDILLKSFDDQTFFVKALQECMIFLGSIQAQNQKDFQNEKFIELMIRLVKILPEETLLILQGLKSSFFVNSDSYLVLLLDIMKTTNSVYVASQCAFVSSNSSLMEQQIRSYIQSQPQNQPIFLQKIKMYKLVLKFINKKLIKSGRCKYNFIVYLRKVHKIYEDCRSISTEKVEKQTVPEIELESKQENVLFSFLDSDDKISFIKNVEFHDWPLNDKEFSLFVSKNQEKIGPITTEKVSFTGDEIKFISMNWRLFDCDVIKKIKKNYSKLFLKYFNEEVEDYIKVEKDDSKLNFIVKKNEPDGQIMVNNCPVSSSSSIFPELKNLSDKGEIIWPTILIKNFFMFKKKFVLTEELFNHLLSLLIDDFLKNGNGFDFHLVFDYAIENGISVNFELIQKMLEDENLFKYVHDISLYLSVASFDHSCEKLKSFLLSVIFKKLKNEQKEDTIKYNEQKEDTIKNNEQKEDTIKYNEQNESKIKYNEQKEGWFTRFLYEIIENENSTDKNIVSNITNLTMTWPFTYCRCFDFDYCQFIQLKLFEEKKIVDAVFLLNSFDYFKELKSTQNSSFFKSTEILRNSTYFISQYFQYIFLLNRQFQYKNDELNQNFTDFLCHFSKFLFDKAEFLVNSNFNQFSVNTENHSNLFHFFRTIELFLYNIYSILKIIEDEQLKETIVKSISKLVKSMSYFFHSIFDSDCLSYVIVHGEIGRILSIILLIWKFDRKIISIDEGQIIDFINKVTTKSGIFSYPCFFECSSFLLKFSSSSLMTNILKNNGGSIIQICKYGNINTFVKIPSNSLSVLRSLLILIQPSLLKVLIDKFYYVFYPSIVDVFRIFGGKKNALVDIMIEKVVRKLLSNQDFNTIQNLVLPYLEKFAKEYVDSESKKNFIENFGLSNRILDIINSVKVV